MVFAHFHFFLVYTTSVIFYCLHGDVIRSSAINLHLTFRICPSQMSIQHCVWSPVRTLGEIQTNCLGASECLTAALPTLMQSNRPRHASVAAGCQCCNFSRFLIIIITHSTAARVDAGFVASDIGIGHRACHFLDI